MSRTPPRERPFSVADDEIEQGSIQVNNTKEMRRIEELRAEISTQSKSRREVLKDTLVTMSL